MGNILVAVDGSAHAQKAIYIAAALAKQSNSSVIVLHTTTDKGVSAEVRKGLEVEYADELRQRLSQLSFTQKLPDETQYARTLLTHSDKVVRAVSTIAGENIIKRAVNQFRENDVDSIETILVHGDPADSIIDASKKHKIDTIVMGSRGTGKLTGLLLGSVSQSVAHKSECTVIIVKP